MPQPNVATQRRQQEECTTATCESGLARGAMRVGFAWGSRPFSASPPPDTTDPHKRGCQSVPCCNDWKCVSGGGADGGLRKAPMAMSLKSFLF